ncbi:hypothetical protein [Actinoplanes sp. NPDC049599]|uniref:hypothetical protein n=1 Tax=Actinoplanes sp. NPDC049599 TaxID=3363903 RepID=UPI00379B29A8
MRLVVLGAPAWRIRSASSSWLRRSDRRTARNAACDPAREALRAELSPVRLAMYLWTSLEEAAGDMPGMPVAEAYGRFIAWTR